MARNEDIVENLWDVRSLDEARSGEIPIGSVGSKDGAGTDDERDWNHRLGSPGRRGLDVEECGECYKGKDNGGDD